LFFAFTLFLSATLLFLVEPLIGKMILPRLGGTPAVWNTCMVFYQAALLLGYAYTHALSTRLDTRRQTLVHAALLALPFLVLPFTLGDWVPPADSNPIPAVLWLLVGLVGLPFFVVAASAPLLQRWFAATGHPAGRDPYFLYGASNLGSMLALLGYPLLVEPNFSVDEQTRIWTIGYALLALMVIGCGALTWGRTPLRPEPGTSGVLPQEDTALTIGRRLRWVALAAAPSSLMLGVTTYLTTDVAAIPLFWVVPLALYLLTFILAFLRWPVDWTRGPHAVVVVVQPLVVLGLVLLTLGWQYPPLRFAFPLNLLAFFLTALLCHGELAADRPPVRYLTEFYLWMAVGGVLGGMFNALVAPLVFPQIIEYVLVLVLALFLRPGMIRLPRWLSGRRPTPPTRGMRPLAMDVAYALWAGLLTLILVRLSFGTMFLGREIPSLNLLLGDLCGKLGLSGHNTHVLTRTLWLFLVAGVPVLVCAVFLLRPLRFGLAVGAVLLAHDFAAPSWRDILYVHRSFYGVQQVVIDTDDFAGSEYNALIHGGINHGWQSRDPARRREPITYFYPTGPVGQVFRTIAWPDARLPASLVGLGTVPLGPLVSLPSEPPYAVIGLGIGCLAAHARPTQHVTFYEIDPAVLRLSLPPAGQTRYFTYLHDALNRGANLEVVLGDGRLSLQKAPQRYYRILVIDAFSSDAIPVHLLTAEAIDLYLDKLADDGMLVFNVTNRYVDLHPVLGDLARRKGLVCWSQDDSSEGIPDKFGSDWVVIARTRSALTRLPLGRLAPVAVCPPAGWPGAIPWAALVHEPPNQWRYLRDRLNPVRWEPLPGPGARVWTDDYSNLLGVMSW
jgi:hypothetical protein